LKRGERKWKEPWPTRQHASAIVHGAVYRGSLAWVAGISLSGLEGSAPDFRRGPADRRRQPYSRDLSGRGDHLWVPVAPRGNIDAHQINQTTWVSSTSA